MAIRAGLLWEILVIAVETLRANKLVYNDRTGVIHGYGSIVIINSDGTFEYAEEIVLDEEVARMLRAIS